jgi:hypothetical protein
MDTPNARERKALRHGCYGGPGGENEAQLYVGQQTIAELLEKGWLERMPDSLNGARLYKTTAAGRRALDTPVPKKVRTTSRLKMLEPRVKPLARKW